MHSSGPLISSSCVSCENNEQGGKVDSKRSKVGAWTKTKNFVSCVTFCFQYQMLWIFCLPNAEVARDLRVTGQTQPHR